jgi:undecaprenyl-diphosphatase
VNPLEAALLGLLQGLTEFLPVSSSGHLVLGQAVLGVRVQGVAFEVAVHVATLLAVLVVYRSRIIDLIQGLLRGDREAAAYVGLLVVASVPAAAFGITARPFLEGAFERPSLAAAFLLLSGVFAWLIDRAAHRQAAIGAEARERPSLLGAVGVGLAQALSILPGISRSGSTVAVGAGAGVDVIRMAEFSFLLSVPAIGGAALLQVLEGKAAWGAVGGSSLIIGFAGAMVAGVLAIHLFVRMLRTQHFSWFAYYCWLIGGVYLMAAAAFPSLR